MPATDFARRGLLALAFALGLSTLTPASVRAQEPSSADPALWVVRDEDSTLYLFGTIHFVQPDTHWRTPRIAAALDASTTLVLEIADPEDQAAVAPLIPRYGFSPDRPLSSLLTAGELARLDGAARTMGASAQQLDPMRPWLAGVMLSSAVIARGGYSPGAGVDVQVRADAVSAGKTIIGIETPEDQIRMLAGFPEDGQLAFLRSTLDDFDKAPVEMDRLASAWAAGDADAVAAITLAPMRQRSERLYQTVIVERNQRWAARIEDMLAGSGTTFIAVGALHLAGDDSVQAMLAAKGISVVRVE